MRRPALLLAAGVLVSFQSACGSGSLAPARGDSGSDANPAYSGDAGDAAVMCLKPGDSFQGPGGTGLVADGGSCPAGYCYLCGILDLPYNYPATCPASYCAPRSGGVGECKNVCPDAGPDGG